MHASFGRGRLDSSKWNHYGGYQNKAGHNLNHTKLTRLCSALKKQGARHISREFSNRFVNHNSPGRSIIHLPEKC